MTRKIISVAALSCCATLGAELDCESVKEAGAGKPGVPFVGSLVRLVCEAHVESSAFAQAVPVPTRLLDLGLVIGGKDAPILSVTKLDERRVEILAQVPREATTVPVNYPDKPDRTTPQNVDVTLVRGAARGTLRREAYLNLGAGEFLRDQAGRPLIVHGDTYELVSETRPARLDEVLIAFLTGVKPPDTPTPDGVPYPVGQLAPITMIATQFDLDAYAIQSALTGGAEMRRDYFGAAPGLIGIYQANFTPPEYRPDIYRDRRTTNVIIGRRYCAGTLPCRNNRFAVRSAASEPAVLAVSLD